jgi:Pyridine nucleotide-disulphide oxidoreductase
VIIGAGPHGLAAAAYLRGAGVETISFGDPLEFWRAHMPAGMILRSRKRVSSIAAPRRALTIERYEQSMGTAVHAPNLLLEEFVAYALWFQRRVVPDVDPRRVEQLDRDGDGFRLRLSGGEALEAARVIVAAGLAPFAKRPAPFAALPTELASHAVDHADLSRFAGQSVIVVGAGQSALESAVLLAESGAQVEVLVRAPSVIWLHEDPAGAKPNRRVPLRPPPTGVGGRLTGWIAAIPDVFRLLPERLHPWISYRCIRPAASSWVERRVGALSISCGCFAIEAEGAGGQVRLRLNDGSERTVDHVLLGTGYAIDVRRYPFMSDRLAGELTVADGYPVLGSGLESSVPGLHFVGAPAAHTFGPIMRFVVGSWYSAPAVAQRVLGRPQLPLRRSF